MSRRSRMFEQRGKQYYDTVSPKRTPVYKAADYVAAYGGRREDWGDMPKTRGKDWHSPVRGLCEFCDKAALHVVKFGNVRFHVQCFSCGVSGPASVSPNEAIWAYNEFREWCHPSPTTEDEAIAQADGLA